MIQYRIPFALLVPDNRRAMRANGRKRIILSPRYRDAKAMATLLCRTQYRGAPLTGRVEVVMHFFMPDNRRRDIGNFCKQAGDVLHAGGAMLDDAQIDQWVLTRVGLDRLDPRAEITVREMGLPPLEAAKVRAARKAASSSTDGV